MNGEAKTLIYLYPSRLRKMVFQFLPHDFTGILECSIMPEYSGVAVSKRLHTFVADKCLCFRLPLDGSAAVWP